MRVWTGVLVFAIVAVVALAIWAPASILNALSRGADVAVERDIPFGVGPRLKLDIYKPAKLAGAAPVLVYFYGGSWQAGEKDSYPFFAAALARAGYVVVVPDYRTYPPVVYPEFLRDSALAVRWVRENAERIGGDASKLFLTGHSAGAYNAVSLALDRRWLAEVGIDPRREVAGVIGIAGPYDFLPLTSPALKIIFGPEATRAATQPIMYADGKAPPMLLMRPASDSVVDPGNSARLAERIRSKGGEVALKTYERVGHTSIIGAVSPLLSFLAPVREDIIAFVNQRSMRSASPAPK